MADLCAANCAPYPAKSQLAHRRQPADSPRRLTADEEAALAAVIIAGPEPERDGVCAWTRADLCRWLEERFAKTYLNPGIPAATDHRSQRRAVQITQQTLPSVNAKVMDLFLAHFADTGPGCARRHDVRRRRSAPSPSPDLGADSPELNPVERVWLRTLPIAPRPRRHRGHSTPVASGSTSSQNRILPARPGYYTVWTRSRSRGGLHWTIAS